jgi:hypothetical protein
MSKDTNTLTMTQNFDLIKLIQDEYTAKGVNDSEFAVYASTKLNLKLFNHHISKRRYEFNIPSNVVKTVAITNGLTKELEERIKNLEYAVGRINETLKLKNLGFFKESLLSE